MMTCLRDAIETGASSGGRRGRPRRFGPSSPVFSLVLAAVVVAASAPRRAYAGTTLQVAATPMSPGTIVDLTSAGMIDWAHWGYLQSGGPYGLGDPPPKLSHKITGGGTIGGNLLVAALPSNSSQKYWMPVRGTTVSFKWSDGTPSNPGPGVTITDGIGADGDTTFTLAAGTSADLRELSIYATFDCSNIAPALKATLGTAPPQTLDDGSLCHGANGAEDVKVTVQYSSDDRNPADLTVVITNEFGSDTTIEATLYAATLSAAGSTSDGGAPDGNLGANGGAAGSAGVGPGAIGGAGGSMRATAGANGSAGARGSGGMAGGGGGIAGTAARSSPSDPPRVLSCAVASSGTSRCGLRTFGATLAVMILAMRRRRPRAAGRSAGGERKLASRR